MTRMIRLFASALVVFFAVLQGPLFAARAADTPASRTRSAAAKPAHAGADQGRRDRNAATKGSAAPRAIAPEGSQDESSDIQARSAWRWQLLTYPAATIPDQPYTKALAWIQEHVPAGYPWPNANVGLPSPPGLLTPVNSGSWTVMGPRPIDMSTQSSGYRYGRVTGRFNAVAVDPRTVGSPGSITAYAGAAAGGLWKSTNCCGAGTTWTSLLDTFPTSTQSFGAIGLDPGNPDVVYAGTGDFDANDQFGEGIMKSTDAGATWSQLAASVFTPYAAGTPLWSNEDIGLLQVDPHNRSTVLAGTRYDLYISHDAGVSWTRCPFGANPTDPTNAANPLLAINRITGIVLDSTANPTTAWLAVGDNQSTRNGDNGVYRTTIPAAGCPVMTLQNSGWPSGTGNGTNGVTNVGRIRLASSRGNISSNLVLYAQVQDATHNNALGTWVSTNQGASWTQLSGSTDSSYKDCTGSLTGEGQDWYDLFLLADPGDDKTLYIGRTSLYKGTVDSGYSSLTLQDLGNVYSTSCAGYGTLHPDQHHATWLSGTGVNSRFLLGNDGGLYAGDGTVGGFTSLNDTINATEFYAGQLGPNFAGGGTQYLFAGAQDNGTASWDSSDPDMTWQARSNGGDGFFSAFDPLNGSLSAGDWFTEYVYGQLARSTTGAAGSFTTLNQPWSNDNPAWSTPYRIDQFHCSTLTCSNLVLGAGHLWSSVNSGSTWTRAGGLIAKSFAGSIIALDFAPSDPQAAIAGSSDGAVQVAMNVFTGSSCTHAFANTATFSCATNTTPTWTDLTQANAVLPNRAINGVTFDPGTTNTVYAAVGGFDVNTPGTPGHVFRATLSGGTWTWTDKTGNLPDVPAESIVINPVNTNQAFVGMDTGFFYTDNIASAKPSWFQYQYGLPTTVVQYLAVDRGAPGTPFTSTTLGAFTYGRGTFAIRLPGTAGFPPHPVLPTMKGSKNVADKTKVDVTYDAVQCPAPNHNLYWGALGTFGTVTGGLCSIGSSGAATGLAIPVSTWWLLVGTDDGGGVISSFGDNSAGQPRGLTGWTGVCPQTTQNNTTTCP